MLKIWLDLLHDLYENSYGVRFLIVVMLLVAYDCKLDDRPYSRPVSVAKNAVP